MKFSILKSCLVFEFCNPELNRIFKHYVTKTCSTLEMHPIKINSATKDRTVKLSFISEYGVIK